jgi:GH43 family beta-xylosidase
MGVPSLDWTFRRPIGNAFCAGIAFLFLTQAQTFTNPLFSSQDPYVTFWNGNYYYIHAPGHNQIQIIKSPTLTGLKSQTPYVAWTSPWFGPNGRANLWGPEIHQIQGRWYIYFSGDFQSNGQHRLYVLQGGSDPLNPYQVPDTGSPNGQLVESTGNWAIDPDVFIAADGQLYITWSCTAFEIATPPQNLCLARMSDPLHVSSATIQISSPTESWETRTAPINEGPIGFVRNGNTYLTYSASASWTPDDYTVGVLLNITGNLLDPKSWTKHGPIFDRHGEAYGPGSVVFAPSPDGTELWSLYHGYDRLDCAPWACRTIRMQKVEWDAAGLPLLGYPVDPSVKSRVPSGETGSSTGWGNSPMETAASGLWSYNSAGSVDSLPGGNGTVQQTFRDNVNPLAYTASAGIQLDNATTGQFGLYAVYLDPGNHVEAYLDTQQGMFISSATVAGEFQGERIYLLPENFDPSVPHTIGVDRSASNQFGFYFDGVATDRRTFAIGSGQVGLFASGPGAHFRGVTVADNSSGWGNAYGDAAQGLTKDVPGIVPANGYAQGSWNISDGATVESSAAGSGWNVLYQGNPNFVNFTAQVDAQLVDPGTSFGLIACYDDRNNQLSVWINPAQNVFTWNAVVKGQSTWQSVALPAGFDSTQTHRLTAAKTGSLFTLLLDGNQMAQATYALANGTSGVATQSAHVQFRNFKVLDQ